MLWTGSWSRWNVPVEPLCVENQSGKARSSQLFLSPAAQQFPASSRAKILPPFPISFKSFSVSSIASFHRHTSVMAFRSTPMDYLVRFLQNAPGWQTHAVVFFLLTGALYSTVQLLSFIRALLSLFVLPGKSVVTSHRLPSFILLPTRLRLTLDLLFR